MSCLSFGQYACYFKALSEFAVTLTVICYTTSRIIKFMYLLLYFLNYDFSNSKHGYSALRLDKEPYILLTFECPSFYLAFIHGIEFLQFFFYFSVPYILRVPSVFYILLTFFYRCWNNLTKRFVHFILILFSDIFLFVFSKDYITRAFNIPGASIFYIIDLFFVCDVGVRNKPTDIPWKQSHGAHVKLKHVQKVMSF